METPITIYQPMQGMTQGVERCWRKFDLNVPLIHLPDSPSMSSVDIQHPENETNTPKPLSCLILLGIYL